MTVPDTQAKPPDQPAGPKVSVLIVSWNCAGALRRCLKAVGAAEGRDEIQTLVVDAGSRDGSETIDNEFPWVTMLRLPRNFGKTRARNIGVRTAVGELILLLDPNVELAPGAIRTLARFLQENEGYSAASASLRTPEDQPVPLQYPMPGVEELKQACKSRATLALAGPASPSAFGVLDAALLVRRVLIKGMNYFDEKRFSEYWADLEMCFQIQNAAKKVGTVPEAEGVLYPAQFSVPLDGEAQALLDADRMGGAANYVSKHYGLLAGLKFRLGFILLNLFDLKRMPALVTGQRVDGSQGGVLG